MNNLKNDNINFEYGFKLYVKFMIKLGKGVGCEHVCMNIYDGLWLMAISA